MTENSMKLILASESPRRRELLTAAGYEFTVSTVKVSEIFDENLNPEDVASHLATLKAEACLRHHKHLNSRGFLILGADTIVALDRRVLGKPKNSDDARRILRLLSGQEHRVITGISLIAPQSAGTKVWAGWDTTLVRFRQLSDSEIWDYVESGEPMDKAGAYAIQGNGGKFVSSYSGSWSNVVGLPMERLDEALKENGWTVSRRTT